MGKVYVVQDVVGRNILGAAAFGQVTPLLDHKAQVMFCAGSVCNFLKEKLSNFNDDDHLLLMGDPVAIGIACSWACHWNKGRAKMLKWDRQTNQYYSVQIDMFAKKEGLENEFK